MQNFIESIVSHKLDLTKELESKNPKFTKFEYLLRKFVDRSAAVDYHALDIKLEKIRSQNEIFLKFYVAHRGGFPYKWGCAKKPSFFTTVI